MDSSVAVRFWPKVRQSSGCWFWTAYRDRKGYGVMNVGGRHGKAELAHRVAWDLLVGPIPPGACVLHSCDNPACVRPAHLFLGTLSDNNADMRAKGRAVLPKRLASPDERARGSRHGNARLTEAQVVEIRQRYTAGGINQTALAAHYGVNQTVVSRIVRQKSWAHVS